MSQSWYYYVGKFLTSLRVCFIVVIELFSSFMQKKIFIKIFSKTTKNKTNSFLSVFEEYFVRNVHLEIDKKVDERKNELHQSFIKGFLTLALLCLFVTAALWHCVHLCRVFLCLHPFIVDSSRSMFLVNLQCAMIENSY